MISKQNKLILNSILIFSILSLSIAYFIEHVLGHKPCNLCLIERYPYIGAIILISFLFIIKKFERLILFIILVFFIFGAVISFYHFGIEQGYFNETFICNLDNNVGAQSKEDLLRQLEKSAPVSCKDVTFRFFGFSLATINTIISFFLSAIMFKIFRNYA